MGVSSRDARRGGVNQRELLDVAVRNITLVCVCVCVHIQALRSIVLPYRLTVCDVTMVIK